MSTVNGSSEVRINLNVSKSLDLSSVQDTLAKSVKTTFSSDETAAHEVDTVFHDKRTLATAANETLDLTASLTNAFGDLVTIFDLKLLYVRNTSTTDSLLVGGAASTQLPIFDDGSDKLLMPPQSHFVLVFEDENGLIVNSNDKLKMEHNAETASSLDYEIVMLGLSSSPTPTPTPSPTPTPTATPTPTP